MKEKLKSLLGIKIDELSDYPSPFMIGKEHDDVLLQEFAVYKLINGSMWEGCTNKNKHFLVGFRKWFWDRHPEIEKPK